MVETFRVVESGVVKAPAKAVYDIIADYRNGHPNIAPKKYFSDIVVVEGGYGSGTKIRFKMHVLGRAREFHARVIEPEPGRVLIEENDEASGGAVTTFTVDPFDGRGESRVTITTDLKPMSRFVRLEKWFASRVLGKVFREELKLLNERVGEVSNGTEKRR